MKTKFTLVSVLAAFATMVSAQAQLTGESIGTGAGGAVSQQVEAPQREITKSIGGNVTSGRVVNIYAVEAPANPSELQAFWATGVASLIASNTLPFNYKVLRAIAPENLTGGRAIALFVDEWAGVSETLALTDNHTIASSPDSYNTLGETNVFGPGNTLTDKAVLVRDGQVIMSGAASQRGQRVIYTLGFKYYSITAQQMRDYMLAFPGFYAKLDVYINGAVAQTLVLRFAAPEFSFKKYGNSFVLSIPDDSSGATYSYATTQFLGTNANWIVRGNIRVGQSLTNAFGPMTSSSLFIRLQ